MIIVLSIVHTPQEIAESGLGKPAVETRHIMTLKKGRWVYIELARSITTSRNLPNTEWWR